MEQVRQKWKGASRATEPPYDHKVRIDTRTREELLLSVLVVQSCGSHLGCDYLPHLYATDASPWASATVVATECIPRKVMEAFWRNRFRKGTKAVFEAPFHLLLKQRCGDHWTSWGQFEASAAALAEENDDDIAFPSVKKDGFISWVDELAGGLHWQKSSRVPRKRCEHINIKQAK